MAIVLVMKLSLLYLRKIIFSVCLSGVSVFVASCGINPAAQQPETPTKPLTADGTASHTDYPVLTGPLTVLSLNVAHGRKDAINQLMLSKQTILQNLGEVAAVLKQSNADIVALQEADGPSRWSGGFDHVAELAQQADYPWHCRIGQARSWLFDYGTALLSRGYFTQTLGHSFTPTPPTTTKGFLLGQVAWQPRKGQPTTILIDIISVHLDFSRSNVRQQQMTEITAVLGGRKNPVIILGDFNSEWLADGSVVVDLAKRAGLHVYQPDAENLVTYKDGKRRLDWILISKELEFRHYAVLPDIVSDHYAIIAEVGLNASANINTLAIDPSKLNNSPCGENVTCNFCE